MPAVPLYRRDGSVRAYAYVDDDDLELVSAYRWHVSAKGYAVHSVSPTEKLFMHVLIMGRPEGMKVDHRDRDKLNNRRENLRVCTNAQNRQNLDAYAGARSSYRGVSQQPNGRWRARVKVDGVEYHGGTWDTEEEAAAVAAALRREHMTHSNETEVAA